MIEFAVTHDGEHWIAENGELRAEARTLAHLDQEVKRLLREDGTLRDGVTLEVLMAFDTASIPRWLHQYQQHYFNRILRVRG
jgi:hypothetical protein